MDTVRSFCHSLWLANTQTRIVSFAGSTFFPPDNYPAILAVAGGGVITSMRERSRPLSRKH